MTALPRQMIIAQRKSSKESKTRDVRAISSNKGTNYEG
jgi:hypothetical protein